MSVGQLHCHACLHKLYGTHALLLLHGQSNLQYSAELGIIVFASMDWLSLLLKSKSKQDRQTDIQTEI